MSLIPLDITGQNVEKILNQFDLKISALRDALRGIGNRTLTDLYDELALIDDLRGALQSVAADTLRVNDAGGSLTIDNTNLDTYLPKLDVALSTRASESTLSGIKGQTDKLTFDASSYLQVNAKAVANPPNLDVALSTRASETTLSSIKAKTDNLDVLLSSRASDSTLSGFSGKFPSAAALADNLGNPTTTLIGSALLGWDGTYWRRLAADTTSRLRTVVEGLPSIPSGSNVIGGVFADYAAANTINQQVSTTEVVGASVDVRRGGRKLVYMSNTEDVSVTVTVEGSYDGTNWFTIRSGISLAASSKALGVLADAHGYVRAKAVASATPTTGTVLICVSRMT